MATVVVLLGSALRIAGLGWGLPAALHPDEPVIVLGALDLAARNSFEPSMYFRPDHLEIQLSYIAYTAYSYLVAGAPVEVAYATDPGVFLLISRSITALFGIATIVLAYLIGRHFGRSTALISAALFAFFPPFIEHSHYATPDVPLTAVLMVVILACMRYQRNPRYPSLLAACGATALAITIKYPGALAAVMIAIVVIIMAVRDRRPLRILGHGTVAVLAVVGFVFLISPVLFTNMAAVVDAIGAESRTVHHGADGLGTGGNLLFYAQSFASVSGVLLLVAGAVGVAAAIRLRFLLAIPLTVGAIFWVALSTVPLHWDRWGVPMYTTPLFFAAIGLASIARYLSGRPWARRWRIPVLASVAVLVGVNLVAASLAVAGRFVAVDTRIASAGQLERLDSTDANTVVEGYTPLSPGTPRNIFDEVAAVDGELEPVDPNDEYIVISSCMYDRYFADEQYAAQQDFYAELESDFEVELDLRAVDEWSGVGLEPLNIARAGSVLAEYAAGGMSGCDIRLYSIP